MSEYSDNLTVADVEAVLRALPDHAITGDEMCPCQNRRHAPDAVARLVEAARAENERLRTIIDNLHAVEEKHRETANAQLHRANRLQVEKGRLRGLLAEAIQWNWNDFEEAPTESSEACLPLLVDLHQRIKSALAQKGGE